MPIRRSPRPKVQFTIVANQVIENRNLSWRARGLLVYLLSRPDDWECRTEHHARISKDGIHTVRSILRELEDARYITRTRYQDAAGHWRIWTNVHDTPRVEDPVDKLGDNSVPRAVNPRQETPHVKQRLTTPSTEKENTRARLEGPFICGECVGTGWRPNQIDELERCDECAGEGLIP